jgi:hypothetical protein
MRIHSGFITPALSQWLSRILVRHHFSIRKESISQTVPLNWREVCTEACGMIRSTMNSASVTRLVNADDMLLQYYPKKTILIAPTNVKRVGSNRGEDEKKWCTVMVSCEMFEPKILAPYVIMTGQPDGTLTRRFASWSGASKVNFHPKHWMDKQGCCCYLEWLKQCYPEQKIGLIYDADTNHFCQEVMDKATELDIILGAVPPGCTSILQICDLILNKPLKQAFKKRYTSWKIRSDPGPGKKYKVDRKDVFCWLEEAHEELEEKMRANCTVSKSFTAYGQNPRCHDQSALHARLARFEEKMESTSHYC